jgi:hypothetical protein
MGEVRLPSHQESIGAVTILDGQGRIVRIVPARDFRRAPMIGTQPIASHLRRGGSRAVTANVAGPRARLVQTAGQGAGERR